MVFQDQEEWRTCLNTGSYGHVRCGKGPQQRSAMSLRCTEVMELPRTKALFVVCVYVYMYASNFATLNNTRFILLNEYINPMN